MFSTPRETVPGPIACEVAFHSYLQCTVVRHSSAMLDVFRLGGENPL